MINAETQLKRLNDDGHAIGVSMYVHPGGRPNCILTLILFLFCEAVPTLLPAT